MLAAAVPAVKRPQRHAGGGCVNSFSSVCAFSFRQMGGDEASAVGNQIVANRLHEFVAIMSASFLSDKRLLTDT
jgi:hypothetical protein